MKDILDGWKKRMMVMVIPLIALTVSVVNHIKYEQEQNPFHKNPSKGGNMTKKLSKENRFLLQVCTLTIIGALGVFMMVLG